jgi:hypothetical protein
LIARNVTALSELVGLNADEFISKKLERIPNLSSAAESEMTRSLLSIDDIDRFFATIKYRTAEFFCVDGNNPIDVSEFSNKGVVDSRKALRLFDRGATIILNQVQLYHPPLSTFCKQLALELSAPCQANVYLTPSGSKGFNLHYDTHDVFMAQIAGAKRWRVYDSVIDLPLASQGTSERLEATGDPFIETELNAGDVLYIPRGWSHEGAAGESTSFHITFGVYFFTWADAILEAVSECLLRGRRYRSSLPLDFLHSDHDGGAIRSTVSEMLVAMASEVDARSLKRSLGDQFNAQCQTSTAGLLKQLVRARLISDHTTVRACSEVQSRTELDGSIVIDVPGGEIRIKDGGREAALACLSGRSTQVGSLSAWLPADARIELVHRLMVAELVRVVG